MPQPLEGIRILDFSDWMTGPVATQMLADFGADVIKVEPVGAGGFHRQDGVMINGISASFLSFNHSKRSISVNLKRPEGKEIAYRLAREVDCITHNFRPGVMERLGLGYDKIKEMNPSVVYAEVSGWGPSGPYRYRKGQDLLGQGMSGGMFMIGEEDGPPQPSANYKADFVCGMQFIIGISMALIAKMRFGIGQRVHVSLLAGQIHNQAQDAEIFLNTGLITRDPQKHRIFRTKDGWIAAGLHFSEICTAADREDLIGDPRFDTLDKQLEHEDEWRAILEPIFLEKTTAEWDEVMAEKDLVGGPILSYEEAFTHPQVTHQDMIIDMEHPYGGSFKSVGLPVQLSETSMKVSRHPPALGEHTIEVLEGVGYSREEIKRLIEEGTVQQYESGG